MTILLIVGYIFLGVVTSVIVGAIMALEPDIFEDICVSLMAALAWPLVWVVAFVYVIVVGLILMSQKLRYHWPW